MKLPRTFTIYDLRSTIWKKSSDTAVAVRRAGIAVNRQSSIVNRKSQSGIALVITLILLSVTLFMAVAFLAISNRERGSVVTETDTVTARLAADSGLANAEAQILATVLQTTNPYNFGLLVSTNYENANGFISGLASPTNVNYDYYFNGTFPLSAGDFIQNVANLWYLPRAPVFAYDRNANTNDFRFYLDLNRNRRFDPNGPVPLIGQNNGYLHPSGIENSSVVDVITNFEVGDPEWIGVLERPDAPHGPNNKFLSRYAFFALPVGNTLDLNAIHNDVQAPLNLNAGAGANDGFFRNQGVGTWEINLAAFLVDLNTNEWGQLVGGAFPNTTYYYYQNLLDVNLGRAFDDARELLAYRYAHNYNTLVPFSGPFGLFPNYPLSGPVDMFPFGLVTTNAFPFYIYSLWPGGLNNPWPGANNTNHYFALASDLFDTSKITAPAFNFIDHLQEVSTNVNPSTYDRYTFYRLLSQLGTDSAPESGKLNVNYMNADANGNIVPDMETNLYAWDARTFFTDAADKMLRAYTTKWFQAAPSNYLATYFNIHTNYFYTDVNGSVLANDMNGLGLTNIPFTGLTNSIPFFGVANIPVFVNNQFVYTPAIQHVLQLAANIYDATTNNTFALGKDFPSVFRPLFSKDSLGNMFVTGYTNVGLVANATDPFYFSQPYDASVIASLVGAGNLPPADNIYGVPWIIGAKKGFPNFNEISVDNVVTITRILDVTRQSLTQGAPIIATNAQYVFSISNSVGVEFWNSYTNAYTNNYEVVVYDNVSMNLTNNQGSFYVGYQPLGQDKSFTSWPGSVWYNGTLDTRYSTPFYIPINANVPFVTNQVYQSSGSGGWVPPGNSPWQTELTLPHLGMLTTNRLQAFILATDSSGHQRVIDYVHFNGPDSQRNLNDEIQTPGTAAGYDNMWSATPDGRIPSLGIASQFGVSADKPAFQQSYWGSTQDDYNRAIAAIVGFTYFIGETPTMSVPTGYEAIYQSYKTNYTVQVPYTPTVTAYYYSSWQANDPLVHTSPGDMIFSDPGGTPRTGTNVYYGSLAYKTKNVTAASGSATNGLLPNIGALNQRYQPWGRAFGYAGADLDPYNSTVKDPMVRQSDDWDFPGNKLPTVGWLGRIHRGTPWQTIYLKATNILGTASGSNTWLHWTGDANAYDATNSAPVQDRMLFDIFTTALNGNATRGQLPINVGAADTNNPAAGLAAWSAVFSGMVVPTNSAGAYTIINPAGTDVRNSPLYALVTNINYVRKSYTNTLSEGGSFKHVGDILSVTKLSQGSPFLAQMNISNNIPDAIMEWLPQQAMSLLRLSDQPRYVIYSYGQTLKPAPNGVVTSGAEAGMITNYQVTAETVTRSVVRIEGAPTNTHAVVESFNVLPPD